MGLAERALAAYEPTAKKLAADAAVAKREREEAEQSKRLQTEATLTEFIHGVLLGGTNESARLLQDETRRSYDRGYVVMVDNVRFFVKVDLNNQPVSLYLAYYTEPTCDATESGPVGWLPVGEAIKDLKHLGEVLHKRV